MQKTINKNTVIMEKGRPRIILTEESAPLGRVPIEEAKRLAKLYARKLIYGK